MANRKLLLVLGVIVFFLLLGYGIKKSLDNRGKTAMVAIEVVPTGAKITANGKRVSAGQNHFFPGAIKFEASQNGFTTETKKITVNSGETSYAGFALRSNSSSTASWYEKHPQDNAKLEAISSKDFDETNDQSSRKNPVLSLLPAVDREFRIDSGASKKHPTETGAIALYIKASTPSGRAGALDWLRTNHIDPSDLEIIFLNAPGSVQ